VEPRQPVIAIIEDDASIRRALARLLRSVGWKAVIFASAEAFLQAAGQEPLDCLVLDIRLPGMSGVALLEHFAVAGLLLPVICMTAHDDVQVRRRAAQAGALAFLPKPVDEQDLLQAIRHALGREIDDKRQNFRSRTRDWSCES
jgi:FixJ family two-component response regulator